MIRLAYPQQERPAASPHASAGVGLHVPHWRTGAHPSSNNFVSFKARSWGDLTDLLLPSDPIQSDIAAGTGPTTMLTARKKTSKLEQG